MEYRSDHLVMSKVLPKLVYLANITLLVENFIQSLFLARYATSGVVRALPLSSVVSIMKSLSSRSVNNSTSLILQKSSLLVSLPNTSSTLRPALAKYSGLNLLVRDTKVLLNDKVLLPWNDTSSLISRSLPLTMF